MSTYWRQCYSCAARPNEAEFPAKKGHHKRLRCIPCQVEEDRVPSNPTVPPMRRAQYRAALLHRQKLPQMDMIDMIVRAP